MIQLQANLLNIQYIQFMGKFEDLDRHLAGSKVFSANFKCESI